MRVKLSNKLTVLFYDEILGLDVPVDYILLVDVLKAFHQACNEEA